MKFATCALARVAPSATSALVNSKVATSGKNAKVSGGRLESVMVSSRSNCSTTTDCSHGQRHVHEKLDESSLSTGNRVCRGSSTTTRHVIERSRSFDGTLDVVDEKCCECPSASKRRHLVHC